MFKRKRSDILEKMYGEGHQKKHSSAGTGFTILVAQHAMRPRLQFLAIKQISNTKALADTSPFRFFRFLILELLHIFILQTCLLLVA